ncbi:protein of unknown function [Chitinophaga terrae (ex Kim and Jung 2007)]|jgi:hypothetical protein|uniref:DUF4194 domain-containing protein n=1 Tax=Chitinophaga terrae (ex Kim and Jung 2007) TaxID=408074 RepID=A0A1H4CQ19_9BACT|nr:DUF4194 domain-containing protein [Chitinophaga terrae (ex Kim and Jung 2007)]MDQ0105186.1 hypothetical protein [Chitinophaga terrae (ex Kim and Jung 2007)]GEP90376.1 hypothetical protein CTE07_20210 [Chitinophaga terrae (ex Kim and Jung 2007)]SEA62398.1 protein of unknown function [Chitinophaga terrae (ex Kim and Jung 2007)]
MAEKNTSPFAHVFLKLMQGPIYEEDKTYWKDLLGWQTELSKYLQQVGLQLVISESDGFARIVQPEADESLADKPLPRLMRKTRLTYEATLLCIVLREALDEFDIKGSGTRLFLTQKEIKERLAIFFKDRHNRSKLLKDLNKPINSLLNVGVLKVTREDAVNKELQQYEVKRIIKALVNNEKLEEIKSKLKLHVNPVQ